jgi:flagellar assembly protein FliH
LSKKFTAGPFQPEAAGEPVFRKIWPDLRPKVYTSSFHQHVAELEEKALKQVREKSVFIEKEAYEKGFAQGERDGLALGQKRVEATLHHLENVLAEIERQRKALDETYEREMLQLVLSISRKIVRYELTSQEQTIGATLREAFQQVVDRRKVIIRVNPTDYQYLQSHPEGFPCFAPDNKAAVQVVEDPSIARGGCFLETPFGEVDATIESQLDEIASLIWEQLDPKRDP